MDCIYLSQKFGRPLVRCPRRCIVSIRVVYHPFVSHTIRGKEAQPSVFRVQCRALTSVPDDPHRVAVREL